MIGYMFAGILAMIIVVLLTYENTGEFTLKWKGTVLMIILLLGGPLSFVAVAVWGLLFQKNFTVFHIEKEKPDEEST